MVFNSARLLLQKSILGTLTARQLRTTHVRYLAATQYANHLHFHQNHHLILGERKEKTGWHFQHRQYNQHAKSVINSLKSNAFHGHSKILSVSYSNYAGQKVNSSSDVKNTKTEEKKEEVKDDVQQQQSVDEKPLTLVGKFKKMAKEYWYVLIPVHAVTSVGWIGGFYYASVNGVDIVGIMESMHISETIIGKLRDSSLGHWAIAYLLYKIASPLRYTVTVGGTTYAINILSSRGIIKPLPSRNEMMQMYKDKKDDIQQKIEDKKQDIQQKIVETKQKVEETKEKVTDKKEELFQKLEDKKHDLQQKVADKKQELEGKIKGRN